LADGADIVQPMPASLECIIDFEFGNPIIVESLNRTNEASTRISIVGPGTYRRHWVRLQAPMDSFAIFFQPMGVRQLFGLPNRALVNREYACFDVFGKSISQLWERMAENTCFDARVRIVEEHLTGFAAKTATCTEIMASASYIFQRGGAVRVNAMAAGLSLGLRHYERRFVEEVGIAPKLFAGITRFQMAMDAKTASATRSWLAIAHEFGYHDQMHMIRDFRRFCGESPGKILRELGDMRPEELAKSDFASQSDGMSLLY
jgi:AraC-like DNA-binding protein